MTRTPKCGVLHIKMRHLRDIILNYTCPVGFEQGRCCESCQRLVNRKELRPKIDPHSTSPPKEIRSTTRRCGVVGHTRPLNRDNICHTVSTPTQRTTCGFCVRCLSFGCCEQSANCPITEPASLLCLPSRFDTPSSLSWFSRRKKSRAKSKRENNLLTTAVQGVGSHSENTMYASHRVLGLDKKGVPCEKNTCANTILGMRLSRQ